MVAHAPPDDDRVAREARVALREGFEVDMISTLAWMAEPASTCPAHKDGDRRPSNNPRDTALPADVASLTPPEGRDDWKATLGERYRPG